MKKNSLIFGVVFCIFILCSLTYQPLIADEFNTSVEPKKSYDKFKWYPHLRCYILKKWVNRIGWWMDIIHYIFPFLDELWSILKDIRLAIWDRFYEIGCNWVLSNDYNDCGCD